MKNLDLVEILKDCPKGTNLYSTVHGEVELKSVTATGAYPVSYPIEVEAMGEPKVFTRTGAYFFEFPGECVLFPSKDQRDWSKFVCPKRPKEDLPVGTLVLAKDYGPSFLIRVYAGKGSCFANGALDINPLEFKTIIPYTFGCKVPSRKELEAIEITDENDYGTSYWEKFE